MDKYCAKIRRPYSNNLRLVWNKARNIGHVMRIYFPYSSLEKCGTIKKTTCC